MPSWSRVFCLCVLAEAYNQGGHIEEGLTALASVSAEERIGYYAPEVHRLEGELRRSLPLPNIDEIECCFQSALRLARERAAKSLELRAATSLARFWSDHGRQAEAVALLKPIYNWFTEGLDLPDLRNARTLLDELTCTSVR